MDSLALDRLNAISTWLNLNPGLLAVILFGATLIFGWVTGIFSALRRKPNLKVDLIDGPTFVCTYGTGEKHGDYDAHRTGVALYLKIVNIGSSPTSIMNISIGYHWHVKPFGRAWWRYRLGWYWLRDSGVALEDFQVSIGKGKKFYPFLIQTSNVSGHSAETYLEIGQGTNGVVYFEQTSSWGGCFPTAKNGRIKLKVQITDSFDRNYTSTHFVSRVTLEEARKFNPSFGKTLAQLHSQEDPFDLPTDQHGNLIPPEL